MVGTKNNTISRYNKLMGKNVHTLLRAVIRTHDLLNISLLL